MAKLEGIDRLQRALKRAGPMATKAFAASAVKEQEKVMADSKENYVPVDLGILKGSGTVLPPEIQGSKVTVVAGYGGAASAYALYQHEELHLAHTVGSPKYLERPFLNRVGKMPKNMAKEIERELQKLGR